MKKTLLVAIALFAALSVNAQNEVEKKNEISIGYGIGTRADAEYAIGSILTAVTTVGNMEVNNIGNSGAFSLEYVHRFNHVIGIGGIISGQQETGDLYSGVTKCGDIKTNYYELMPEIKFNWLNTKYVTLYSKLAGGLRYSHEIYTYDPTEGEGEIDKTDDEDFSFQISAIGLELGSTISGFTELGYGDQGILIVGLKCKF